MRVACVWIMRWAVPFAAIMGGLLGSPPDSDRAFAQAPWQPINYRITQIRLAPMGYVPAQEVDAIRGILAQEFQRIRVTVGDGQDLPAASFDPTREQYNADVLLPILARRSEHQSVRVLGVTTVDLFTPRLNFLFSLAQPEGRAAVMSLRRLQDPDPGVRLARYRKIALRTLGITFGFPPASDRSCVMAYSNSLLELDRKGTAWCDNEPDLLRRIQGLAP